MSVALTEVANVVVPVLVPARTFRNDLRAIKIVWHRDIIRFWRDKPRIVASLIQPVLYLFVLGTGLSSMIPAGRGRRLAMARRRLN